MKLYNTLTKSIDEIKPLQPGKLKLFVCGLTVYDYVHIGNAKTYTQSDMLVRYLRHAGYAVTYLQNITDIDDKIINRANDRGIDTASLASQFEVAYLEDMQRLGNTSVDIYAKATDHIADIIRQIQILIEKGFAYKIDDGIYFEISKFPEYGKLSGRTGVQEDDAQNRVDESSQKRGWNDFCLWKFSKPNEPEWPAPFGGGRPGWHIEDTAISEHFFGPQYDIHGGAVDLIFPHHEAEITQMESASGLAPFVGLWFHVGFLTVDDKRMGKSVGNFVTLRELFDKGYDKPTLRMFFLQSHYRKSLNFSYDGLDAARNRISNWRDVAVMRWQPNSSAKAVIGELDKAIVEIEAALSNDFDTPKMLETVENVFDLVRDGVDKSSIVVFNKILELIDEIFALDLLTSTPDIDQSAKGLVLTREAARQAGDWSKSDALREELLKEGIAVRDTKQGTIWSRVV